MKLSNSYIEFCSEFSKPARALHFNKLKLLYLNKQLAKDLKLELPDDQAEIANLLSGQSLFENSKPSALAYAGHQFGNFVPQLGDGRALLLGEFSFAEQTFDLQLKGSGPTEFSRTGDGLSPLGPALREYLLSEAMSKLGVPTTRSLAVVTTDKTVLRETPLTSAILTRIAESHIRVGTFEYFAARDDEGALKKLLLYCIKRHAPELEGKKNKADLFFKQVCEKSLRLVAKWMGYGFIHGVLNTDNTSIAGQTIDYGPCAFIDTYNPSQVYSYIDRRGRYAYNNQASIIIWNMSCLANALFPLLKLEGETDEVTATRLTEYFKSLQGFYKKEYYKVFTEKLGLFTTKESDHLLVDEFLSLLGKNKLDFTESFRALSQLKTIDKNFESKWLARLKEQNKADADMIKLLNSKNPRIIARNHLVERALTQASKGDFAFFDEFYSALQHPFEDSDLSWNSPPSSEQVIDNTFCGT